MANVEQPPLFDFEDDKRFEAPKYEPRTYLPEKTDVHRELGGNVPTEMSRDSEDALYDQGYGNREFRARVEKRRLAEQRALEKATEEQARAEALPGYKVGIPMLNEQTIELDRQRGVDVDSPEYQAKLAAHRINKTS